MIKLEELLSAPLLSEMIDKGYVVKRYHRDYPLAILNYTDKAQFDNEWNPVTRQCRGLIYNIETGDIIARPFPKFFNYGQPGADEIDPNETAYVTDKMDGSLGIAYRTPDGELAIATRGSFHSEQAEWATEWLYKNASPGELERLARWSKTYTDLFEIIYPENRIVVDYGSRAELVYLASVHVYCGGAERFSDIMPVPSTPVLAGSLEGALDLEPRENAEGVVVMTADGRAVKLKQEDYLLKHRARFNLTPRRLWEAIAADVTLQDFLDGMPDEFHKDIKDAWVRIEDKGLGYASDCRFLARRVAPLASRKEQAQALNDMYPELASGVFAVLDSDMRKLHRAAVRYMEPKGPEASRLIA